MTNDNQRVENLVAVGAPSRLDANALATKFRLFTEAGDPIDVASFEARLRVLEGYEEPEEEVEEEGSEVITEEGSEVITEEGSEEA